VLGPLLMECDGAPVDLPGVRSRMVLALLLMHRGTPLSVGRLSDELWGEAIPRSAQSALHVHLSTLRRRLGPVLVRASGGYLLASDSFDLDEDRFDGLVQGAAANRAHASALLASALKLWRGEPLSDLPFDGLEGWRRSLDEKRLRATVLRIDADLRLGIAGELIAELERLVSQYPYEERLWEQLMLALYRQHRQADALEAFQRARRLFVSELGIDPGEGLRGMHNRILEQDPELLAHGLETATAPPLAEGGGARSATTRKPLLPQPTTRLVGRDVDLLELEAICDDPFVRLISFVGPGGVGKTRLAIAHAQRWSGAFADGAVFVGLAALTDPSQVRSEIAAVLARRDAARDLTEAGLVRFLCERRLLLVLDNFEHLLPAADLVVELLENAPDLKILLMSRVELRLRGEHRYEVDPLSVQGPGKPDGGPAVELFVQGARAVDRRFSTTAENRTTIAEICRALDGLPLAIELAAARSRALTVAEIAAQLAEPLTVGRRALRDMPDRHQTLDAAIGWSYNLLAADTQRTLRVASIFHGEFTSEALAAVAKTPVAVELDDLLEANLVQLGPGRGPFLLLQLVRAFGRERLAETGEADAAQAALRDYLVARYAAVAADDFPAEPGSTARDMAADHADLRAAVNGAVAAGDAAAAVTLTRALQPIWMTGQLEEAGTIVDDVLRAFEISPEDELHLLKMASFANSYRPSNEYWSRRRITRARELGYVSPQVAALANLTAQTLNRRDVAEALELRNELLPVADDPDVRPGSRSAALWVLARCAFVEGDLGAACDLADRAVAAAEASGHPHMLTLARTVRLQVRSARDRAISRAELAEVIDGALQLQITDCAITALWNGARYVVVFDRTLAGAVLAHAERLLLVAGGDQWPESQLKEETLELLGLTDASTLLGPTPVRELADVLTELSEWLAARHPDERALRTQRALKIAD
jgi:predicted ATPase/DNA-binding SARP family transcriptional activator